MKRTAKKTARRNPTDAKRPAKASGFKKRTAKKKTGGNRRSDEKLKHETRGSGKRSAKKRPGGKRPMGKRPAKKGGPQKPHDPNAPMRLQKFLASCGLGSRRACEEFITDGRVTVNGEVATLGATVDTKTQQVHLDGTHLRPEARRYYLLNKPRGVICTNNDPAGRPRVIDLFPEDAPRLFPVGRLDEDSEGLLIVTNDGDFAHLLAHPRHRIYRTYVVQVAGDPPRETLDQLKKGFFFAEGKFKVHDVKPIRKQGQSTFLEIQLTEGQNREIRRLMARIGHKVMTLQRVAFGPIQLGRVKVGKHRVLRDEEIKNLEAIVERNMAETHKSESENGSTSKLS